MDTFPVLNYEYSDDYCRAFANLFEESDGNRIFPIDLIEGWSSLILSIKKGYNDIPEEYSSDVYSLKGDLDFITKQELLNIYPEHLQFKEIISQFDEKFKMVTQPGAWGPEEDEWRETRMPKIAGIKFIESFGKGQLEKLGLKIEVSPES